MQGIDGVGAMCVTVRITLKSERALYLATIKGGNVLEDERRSTQKRGKSIKIGVWVTVDTKIGIWDFCEREKHEPLVV